MSVSIATKLHFLLIMTIIGVGLYMYLLYKEIRSFEKDITDLRIKVQSISVAQQQTSGQHHAQPIDVVDDSIPDSCYVKHQDEVLNNEVVTANNDDDNMSVTSNEIKDILTNIQDDEQQVSESQIVQDKKPDEVKPSIDAEFKGMSEGELASKKYDDLRNYLRKNGINVRGTKQEMINKILALP